MANQLTSFCEIYYFIYSVVFSLPPSANFNLLCIDNHVM